jgi:hypothetical protein
MNITNNSKSQFDKTINNSESPNIGKNFQLPMEVINQDNKIDLSTNSKSFIPEASEELTFHFSEIAEATETALEERLAQHKTKMNKFNSLSLIQLTKIMKMIEGKKGYEELRMQARTFGTMFQINPDLAIKQLEIQSLSPERKFTILKTFLDSLYFSSNLINIKSSLDEYIDQTENPFLSAHKLHIKNSVGLYKDQDGDRTENFYNAVSMQPTLSSLWTQLEQHSNESLLDTLKRFNNSWGDGSNIDGLKNVGIMIIVQRVIQIIQTMIYETEEFLKRMGILNISKGDTLQKGAYLLIELTQTSMPGSTIEKIITAIKNSNRKCTRCIKTTSEICLICKQNILTCKCSSKSVCRCDNLRGNILSALHWHLRHWPLDVWNRADNKKLVMEQLLLKQSVPKGLIAKRLTGYI